MLYGAIRFGMPTDASASPYRPGFSQMPSVLAGRDRVLRASQRAIGAVADAGRPDRPLVLIGTRGMGKTVLLTTIANEAGERLGAPHLHVEVTPGRPFLPSLLERVEVVSRLVEGQPAREGLKLSEAVLRAGVGALGAEVHFGRESHVAALPDLQGALSRLADATAGRGSGFVLTVDEVQVASREELGVLAAALQAGTAAQWPMVVALAGLPSMRPSPQSADREGQRGITYLERALWLEVGALDLGPTIEALTGPAKEAGRPFDPAAALSLAEQTGGYPYAIQVYGDHAWWASQGRPLIDQAAVGQALIDGRADLEAGLYGSRWSESPRREREYMLAVADLARAGEQATGKRVAERLGTTTRALSSFRDRLIHRGTLLVEGDHRTLRFTVPGMAEYVLIQAHHEGLALPLHEHESSGPQLLGDLLGEREAHEAPPGRPTRDAPERGLRPKAYEPPRDFGR